MLRAKLIKKENNKKPRPIWIAFSTILFVGFLIGMGAHTYTGDVQFNDIEINMLESHAEKEYPTDTILNSSVDRLVRGSMILGAGIVGIGYFIGQFFWFLNFLNTAFVLYFIYRLIFSMLPVKIKFFFDPPINQKLYK